MTVQQFYEQKVIHKLNSPEEEELEAAFRGKSKESLAKIGLSLSLDSRILLFGPFCATTTAALNKFHPLLVMLSPFACCVHMTVLCCICIAMYVVPYTG